MTELLTAAQMGVIERTAIESGGVTGLELMERAGCGTVEAILEEWPELGEGERRAVVLCGPGNNGGDGFVVARLLRERGWAVEVFLLGDPDKLPPDAWVNHGRWSAAGGEVLPLDETAEGDVADADVVVDAMFGGGLTRAVPDVVLNALADTNYHETRLVAVDALSGLDLRSGLYRKDEASHVPSAQITVTFQVPKVGHFVADGPARSGRLRVVDIGLEPEVESAMRRWDEARAHAGANCWLAGVPPRDGTGWRRLPDDALGKGDGHKYDHGHALVLSGGPGKGGAARMAARGALRIGAGLVTLGCPPAALQENASRMDAVMTRAVRGEEGLAAMLEDGRLNALALGPGLGTGERQAAVVRVALGGGADDAGPTDDLRPGAEAGASPAAESDGAGEDNGAPGSTRGLERQGVTVGSEGGAEDRGPGPGAAAQEEAGGSSAPEGDGGRPAAPERGRRPAVVLDADALTILAREPEVFALLHDRCVLTPHAGEFARLFPDIAERLDDPAETAPAYSKVDATRDAAARAGCVVLFKGPDTVIAHPDGRAAINSAHYERSAPWLATAGAGDVLTGFVAGLLARGLAPMEAAEAAAWLHVECALEFGPGLIAEDLPEQLPRCSGGWDSEGPAMS